MTLPPPNSITNEKKFSTIMTSVIRTAFPGNSIRSDTFLRYGNSPDQWAADTDWAPFLLFWNLLTGPSQAACVRPSSCPFAGEETHDQTGWPGRSDPDQESWSENGGWGGKGAQSRKMWQVLWVRTLPFLCQGPRPSTESI